MSGGRFDYKDSSLKNEISELVWDVLDLIHDFDWYISGDTCKETYLKSKSDFKKKWFSNRGVRVRGIVDDAINQCKNELYETFGFEKTLKITTQPRMKVQRNEKQEEKR